MAFFKEIGVGMLIWSSSSTSEYINQFSDSLVSDCLLVLLLIEGKAHAYVFPSKGCKKWDTCAPEALLQAFGGKLTDIHGKQYQYHSAVQHVNSTGVLATYLESVHEWYIANIPQETKDALQ